MVQASVYVSEGTVNADIAFTCTNNSVTIGSTNITFVQFTGGGALTAGNGIAITGNSVAIDTATTVDKTTVQTLTNKTLTSPTLTTPAIGTPSSGILTNCTGTAAGLTAGNTVTNANSTGAITSVGNATSLGSFTTAQLNTALSDNDVATLAGTETLTNKRITKRAPTITQSATPTINTDVTDVAHIIGLAQAITSFSTNLTGTPVEGDTLRIDITDNGTARAITW